MDPATFESRAASILDGLGFSDARMKVQTKDLSGGWRMVYRVLTLLARCSCSRSVCQTNSFDS